MRNQRASSNFSWIRRTHLNVNIAEKCMTSIPPRRDRVKQEEGLQKEKLWIQTNPKRVGLYLLLHMVHQRLKRDTWSSRCNIFLFYPYVYSMESITIKNIYIFVCLYLSNIDIDRQRYKERKIDMNRQYRVSIKLI